MAKFIRITYGTAINTILVGRCMPDGSTGLLTSATLYAAHNFERLDKKCNRETRFRILYDSDWLATIRVHVINVNIAGPAYGVFRYFIQKGIKKGMGLVADPGHGARARNQLGQRCIRKSPPLLQSSDEFQFTAMQTSALKSIFQNAMPVYRV